MFCSVFSTVVFQAASVCVFGGFAARDYGVTGVESSRFTYLGWCFWLALTASLMTLIAGSLFALVGFFVNRFRVVP
jgi:hypothetical protein